MIQADYHYNGIARSLSNGTNNRIGLMVPFLDHPYFQKLVSAVSEAASKMDKEIVILPTNYNSKKEQEYLEELEHHLFSSLIVTSHNLSISTFNSYQRFGPIVLFDDRDKTPYRCISTNREQEFCLVFSKLRQAGKNKIGLLFIRDSTQSRTTAEALSAYKKVFNCEPQENLIAYSGFSPQDGYSTIDRFYKQESNIQALLTESDISAAGAIKYVRERDLPITVIGQGDQLLSKLLNFSSIDQHLTEMGQKAVDLAVKESSLKQQITINFNINWR